MRAWLLVLLLLCSGASYAEEPFDPGQAEFTVKVHDLAVSHRVMALTAMPGEVMDFELAGAGAESEFEIVVSAGELGPLKSGRWTWHAPAEPGSYRIVVAERGGDVMILNVFVLTPLSLAKYGVLNGYRIGYYPFIPLSGLEVYLPPEGMVEVTPELLDTPLSPHFTLGQFVCKQEGDFPKYIVLRTRLLMKLELILAELNARGIRCDSFAVLSGFRTPYYNELIGNVRYSRHVYGGAADIFIDESPMDGEMDDLNGDGASDLRDAQVLYAIIEEMEGRHFQEAFVGGLGKYRRTKSHSPFVHVDVRGFKARWGD